MFQEKLSLVKQSFLSHTNRIEKAAHGSIEGFLNREKDRLHHVLDVDFPVIALSCGLIDELCMNTISCYQPKAGDLNEILSMMVMNSKLKILSFQIAKVAEAGIYFFTQPPIFYPREISSMSTLILKNMELCISFFLNCRSDMKEIIREQRDYFSALFEKFLKDIVSSEKGQIEPVCRLVQVGFIFDRIIELNQRICQDACLLQKRDEKAMNAENPAPDSHLEGITALFSEET
ncbi:MAG: hypothetical protein JW928_00570 [Candidatus Aureabacteria bacterium]|nr:hypothetical protein [Candidatus Auribacterota bacterium]